MAMTVLGRLAHPCAAPYPIFAVSLADMERLEQMGSRHFIACKS
jgi:hypothetical protein